MGLWFVLVGLWGSAVLLAGAGATAILGAGTVGCSRRGVKALTGLVAVVLLLRALGVEVLLLGGVGGVGEAVSAAERNASLWVWNPWFFLGGVLFALATLAGWNRR